MARPHWRTATVPVALLLLSSTFYAGLIGTPVAAFADTTTTTTTTVTGLTVPDNQVEFTLSPGETDTMRLTATNSDGSTDVPSNSEVTYTSSNKAVATVDGNGVITAVAVGSATITATDDGQTATSTVAVVVPQTNSGNPVPKTITSPATGRTYDLEWDDEFNGPAGYAPDQYKWTYQLGNGTNPTGWGNNEQEYYTSSRQNAYLNGKGDLVIQALPQNIDGFKYTSARLNSRNTGSWRYGYIEVNAQLPPGGPGIWPAIWMMPTNNSYGGWPDSGEIDMMEAIDNAMTTTYSTTHFGAHFTYPSVGWGQTNSFLQGAEALPNTGFNTYAVEWTPNHLRFYVDNHLISDQSASQWFSGFGQPNAPFDQPFHMIMNIAVGGYWPGDPNSSTFLDANGNAIQQKMRINYVRAYRLQHSFAWPLPGRFNASDFISEKGVMTETSTDLQYVKGIQATPDQANEPMTYDQDVTYTPGSSTSYNVVVTPGTYEVEYRVASAAGGATAAVSLDGKPISSVMVPATGGDQVWQTVDDPNFVTFTSAQAGKHQLTISGAGGTFNLHWLRLIPAGPRVIEGFESTTQKFPLGTYTYGTAAMTASREYGVQNANGTQIASAYQGNFDMKLNYSLGATGTNVSEFYVHPMDNLTPDSGLNLEVYGEDTGNEFQVNLEATGHELFNFVDPNLSGYTFKDDFTGWKTITLPFSELVKAANQPDPGTSPDFTNPDLSDVYAVDLLDVTPGSQGTLYVDDLRTYDNNDPSEQPPASNVPTIPYQAIPGLINGDSFQTDTNVQTQPTSDTPGTGDGVDVGYIYSGSAMGYFINVPTTGNYTIDYRVSNGSAQPGEIDMYEDGTKVGTAMVAPTGSWTTWTDVSDVVHLTAGNHLINLETSTGNFNLHWFKVSQSTAGTLLGIALDQQNYSLTAGGSTVMAYVYGTYSNAFDAATPMTTTPVGSGVTFVSSNPSVASVDSSGTLTPISAGIANLTATDGTFTAMAPIAVAQASGGGTGTGSGHSNEPYTQSVAEASPTTALVTFTPTQTAQYVILHYTLPGQVQQNVNMAGSNGTWTYTIPDLTSGEQVSYNYTYNFAGVQSDSPDYTYTMGSDLVGIMPEVPFAGALPLLGMAGLGAFFMRRRRQSK